MLFMAGRFLIHLLTRLDPTVRKRRGLPRFQDAFYPERLLPLGPEERERKRSAEGCTACGICEPEDWSVGLSPMRLALLVARETSGGPTPPLGSLENYRLAQDRCPERVPIAGFAEALSRGARESSP